MNQPILQVENVSKQYHLGEVGTGTLQNDFKRWWYKLRGLEDPFLKISEKNDRTTKGKSDFVWALKDVNFEINRGDVVGIVGKNGAGKSTLLKILSKTVTPTTGTVRVNGKIASLLEVGTGFNPELTGRDNIFLNGAIMGMTRKETKAKFDEIVQFAGIERYIDTPVKRYSSGMYVRLAFSVAAFLDADIMILDEVLGVGDSEFQKKAFDKMSEIIRDEGRTVLFVSHHLSAVKEICKYCILLEQGEVTHIGDVEDIMVSYQHKEAKETYDHSGDIKNAIGNKDIRISHFGVAPLFGHTIDLHSGILVDLIFYNYLENINLDATFELRTIEGHIVFHTGTLITKNHDSKIGEYSVSFKIPPRLLNAGFYYFKLIFGNNQTVALLTVDDLIGFKVENIEVGKVKYVLPGVIRPDLTFDVKT